MQPPHKHLSTKPSDFWLARGAVLVIVMLQLGIVNDLTIGPRWLAPALELALLIPLSLATAWTQKAAGRASSDPQWQLVGRDRHVFTGADPRFQLFAHSRVLERADQSAQAAATAGSISATIAGKHLQRHLQQGIAAALLLATHQAAK